MSTISTVACLKLERELKEFTEKRVSVNCWRERLIAPFVAEKLKVICTTQDSFADIIIRTRRTLADCCKAIITSLDSKDVVSDLEVYRKALQFYMPDTDLDFNMIVTLNSLPDDEYIAKEPDPEPKPEPAVPKTQTKKIKKAQAAKKAATKAEEEPGKKDLKEQEYTQMQISVI